MSIARLIEASRIDSVTVDMESPAAQGYDLFVDDEKKSKVHVAVPKQTRYPNGRLTLYSVTRARRAELPLQVAFKFFQGVNYYCYALDSAVNLFVLDEFGQPVTVFDPPLAVTIDFDADDIRIARLADRELEGRNDALFLDQDKNSSEQPPKVSAFQPSVERLRAFQLRELDETLGPGDDPFDRLCVLVGTSALQLSQEKNWNPPGWSLPAADPAEPLGNGSYRIKIYINQLSATDDDFVKAHRKGKPIHGYP